MGIIVGLVIMLVLSAVTYYIDKTLLEKEINWTSSIYLLLGIIYEKIIQIFILGG